MAEKKLTVRFATSGGQDVRTELQGLGQAGVQAFGQIERGQKSAADSAAIFEAALEREEQAFRDLRASLDPAFAATQRYERAVEQATAAVRAGVATQEEANRVIAMARGRLDTFGAGVAATGGGMNSLRGQVQNAAFQIGDFAVQVGAGTAVSTALAQQLPQLIGGFGVLGAVIGAGVAIGVPLLTAAFRDNREEAQTVDDAINDVIGAMSDYREAAVLAVQTTGQLQEEFGSFADEIRRAADYLAAVKLGILTDNMQAAIEPLKAGLAEIEAAMQQVSERADQLILESGQFGQDPARLQMIVDMAESTGEAAREAAADLGLTVEQALQLADALGAVGDAKGPEEIARRAAEALALIQSFAPEGTALNSELQTAADYLGQLVIEGGRTVGAIEDATAAAAALGGGFAGATSAGQGLYGVILAAANAAWDLAAGMYAAAGSAANRALGDDERGSQRDIRDMSTNGVGEFYASQGLAASRRNSAAYLAPPRATGGGSPGSGATQEPEWWGAMEDATRAAREEFLATEQAAEAAADRGVDAVTDIFTSIVTGSKTAQEAVADLLLQLAEVQFQKAILGLSSSGGFLGSMFGSLGTALDPTAGLPEYDGGGYTGSAPRTGGVDGRGGFLAVMHPQESVIDHTKGQTMGVTNVTYNIDARGAEAGVEQKILQALQSYDRQLPGRVRQINGDPRKR